MGGWRGRLPPEENHQAVACRSAEQELRHPLKNGIVYWRGGEVAQEMKQLHIRGLKWKLYPIADFFEEEFFVGKYLLHVWWK